MALDWPVSNGGAVVLSAEDERFEWVDGTDPERRFRVASVTKLLTALAALAAVEAGRIGLDDPVPEAAAGATLRNLLAHASGLPSEDGGPRPPETRRIYSNLGYRRLAAAVAGAVGMPFPDWLGDRVLKPLGMRATTLEPWTDWDQPDPAAGANATLADLALLASCLLDQGAPVIGPATFADMVRVQFPGLAGLVPGVGRFDPCDWGLGPELKDGKEPHWMGTRRGPAAFGHFGGSGCFLWVDPDAGLAAAAVSDRPFQDGRWGMATWPDWSDAIQPP